MMKRSLLAVAVTALSIQTAYAAPFMPMDARGLAMGNTGVASAKLAHAPAYNPSLLAQAGEKDDFALLFPQIGLNLADQEEMIDKAEKIADDILPQFEDIVSSATSALDLSTTVNNLKTSLGSLDANGIVNNIASIKSSVQTLNPIATDFEKVTNELTNSLDGMSGNPLSAQLGIGSALAIPSKKFAAALSISGSANISAKANFSDDDLTLLRAYAGEVNGYVSAANDLINVAEQSPTNTAEIERLANALRNYESDSSYAGLNGGKIFEGGQLSTAAEDPNLSSTLHLVAVATVDLGISFAREFDFGGEKVAIGITPKLQKVSTFHYADEIDGFEDVDEDTLTDSQEDYTHFNLDIGASYRFGAAGNWMVGLTGKNLLGGSFDYKDVKVDINGVTETIEGGSVKLNPQFRGGVAYQSQWVNVAFDLDLTENKPVAFEAPTQFAAIGIELDVFRTMQVRAGFRTNLAESGTNIASIGLGFSPFGVHIDLAAMANIDKPEKEAGVAFETGFYF